MNLNERIVIVGGGLSGLTLAYLFLKKNIKPIVLEASPRLGGRVQTIRGNLNTPLELGATWFSDIHPNLINLIEELGLQKYPQFSKGKSLFQTKSFEPPQEFYVPEADNPSYRIVGGTQELIATLGQKIASENVKLNTIVVGIKEAQNKLILTTATGKLIAADKVILCIPPQLAGSQIKFSPKLPDNISSILPTVQTWMAGSIKFVLEYREPFWRKKGYSGMLFSHAGIVVEMHDHTNYEESKFGFTGFLNGLAASYSREVRKKLVLKQLEELLGKETQKPVTYSDKIWTDEFIIGGNQLVERPHQNNGHPVLHQSYLNGKLFFSGTETSTEFGGYMEGAVTSALKTVKQF